MNLSLIATTDLERLRAALLAQRLTLPLTRLGLQAEGLSGLSSQLPLFGVLDREAVIAVLEAVLAERAQRAPAPELVWTGPESRASEARDTGVVLAELFRSAKSTVLVAGFAFDHSARLLEPLHGAMVRGVSCRLFVDAAAATDFQRDHWPFGPPFPELLSFVPRAGVFASLHAKCVVVDGRRVFITSANFTDRGQTRNIEVGVVLDDARLAAVLEAQFVAGDWFRRVD